MKILAATWGKHEKDKFKPADDFIVQIDKKKLESHLRKLRIPYRIDQDELFLFVVKIASGMSNSDYACGAIERSRAPEEEDMCSLELTHNGINKINSVLKILGIEIGISASQRLSN